MTPVRVLVVDDHTLFRQGTISALQALGGIDVVGEAENGVEAVQKARLLRPQVVLMDLSMPGIPGVEATRRIVEQAPGTRVVVLTYLDDEGSLLSALRAGASGYLLKNLGPEELWAHVRAAAAGDTPIAGAMAIRLARSLEQSRSAVAAGEMGLSQRERQLIGLVMKGQTNSEIGQALYLSVSTVKLYVRRVLQKLSLRNRAELINYATRNGITGT